jgi:hypothetical protein
MTNLGDDNNTITTEKSMRQQQRYQEDSIENEASETADTLKQDVESTFDKIKAE